MEHISLVVILWSSLDLNFLFHQNFKIKYNTQKFSGDGDIYILPLLGEGSL